MKKRVSNQSLKSEKRIVSGIEWTTLIICVLLWKYLLHFFLNRAFAILFFSISNDLLQLLISWEKQQRYELAKFGIISNPEQFVFTYIDTRGNINKPLHADYLNNKMKSIIKSWHMLHLINCDIQEQRLLNKQEWA